MGDEQFRKMTTTTKMAASKQNHDETKDKHKSWQYAQEIEPDREVLNLYCDQLLDCGIYKLEYKECKSMKGKLNQHFIYGQTLDCEHLNDAYKSCMHYMKTEDERAKEYLVTYELAKRDFRMASARANDVWEYRTAPYKEWDSPVQRVKPEEISEDNDLIPARQNVNLNNPNSNDVNNSKLSEKSDLPENQSSQKGGNSKADVSKTVIEPNAGEASNNKGICVIS